MIYKALEVIKIFLAGRTNERTNEGVLRGPRGPKKKVINSLLREVAGDVVLVTGAGHGMGR